MMKCYDRLLPLGRLCRRARFGGLLLMVLLMAGCIADPVIPPGSTPVNATRGVLVINEGLWRQDNASLTMYDPATGDVIQDFFGVKNPGRRLGDVANSVVVWKERAYIVISTSQAIEVVELPSGRSLGTVRLPAGSEPRAATIVNDSVAFVSNLYDDSVTEFNPTTLSVGRRIPTGPAPEGIASIGGRLFVANSGYGQLREREPNAGTISVLDALMGSEIELLSLRPNPLVLTTDASSGKLYALYGMPFPDSLGGIVEYDPVTLRELRRWPIFGTGVAGAMAVDTASRAVYAIAKEGVVQVDLAAQEMRTELFIPHASWPGLLFYSVGVQPGSGDLYLATLKTFTTPGEVLVFDRNGAFKRRFPCGLVPGSFAFF